MHTLRSIAEDSGVDKDTIRKRYERAKIKHGDLGRIVDGVRKFSDEEKGILDRFAGEPRTKVDKPFEPLVQPGNHQTVIDNPEALEVVSLERFRHRDVESVSFADTDDIFAKIDNGLACIEQAMDADIAKREAKLLHDKANQRKIQRRVQEFGLKSMEYRLEARLAAQQQSETTQATSELIQLFQQLQEGGA